MIRKVIRLSTTQTVDPVYLRLVKLRSSRSYVSSSTPRLRSASIFALTSEGPVTRSVSNNSRRLSGPNPQTFRAASTWAQSGQIACPVPMSSSPAPHSVIDWVDDSLHPVHAQVEIPFRVLHTQVLSQLCFPSGAADGLRGGSLGSMRSCGTALSSSRSVSKIRGVFLHSTHRLTPP